MNPVSLATGDGWFYNSATAKWDNHPAARTDASNTFTASQTINGDLTLSSGATISTSSGSLSVVAFTGQIAFASSGILGIRSGTTYTMASNGLINWTATTSNFQSATLDTGFYRVAAGQVGLYDANAGSNVSFFLQRKSSTTNQRSMASLDAAAVDNTDATRKYRAVLNVYDTAAREVMRGEASGSAALVGFLGATAVARQTITGSRGANAALASLLTGLANLGLITDSTT